MENICKRQYTYVQTFGEANCSRATEKNWERTDISQKKKYFKAKRAEFESKDEVKLKLN